MHAANSAATLRDAGEPHRHGALRHRDLRLRPDERGSGRLGSRAGAQPAQLRRRGQADARRGERRLRAAVHRARGHAGSRRCRSATTTGSRWRCATTATSSSAAAATRSSGAVSMDNITVDLGPSTDVEVGAVATLIGADGAERQSAEEVAKRIGTINYEVVCWISKRVPRRYHRDGIDAARPSRRPRDERAAGRARGAPERAWLVGGARPRRAARARDAGLRHRLSTATPKAVARELARRGDAPRVRAVGRVRRLAGRRPRSQLADRPDAADGRVDRADLARRDLTINAIARELGSGATCSIRSAAATDLAARRLRMVGAVRLQRRSAAGAAARPARGRARVRRSTRETARGRRGERARARGRRRRARVHASCGCSICGSRPRSGALRDDGELGATAVVLPELVALHGVAQSDYHHLDVHDHTLEVLAADDRARPRDPGACSASRRPTSPRCSTSRSRTR